MRACRHTRNTTTSSLFLYRFQHPFCCKTKLGGHFKGGVIPLSFFKVNVTSNIYKSERLVWPVKILIFNFSPALYYLNAWKKQAIWRFLFIFLTPLTAFYEYSWNARRVLWRLARETHAPEDWVLRETNMATNQTVWHVRSEIGPKVTLFGLKELGFDLHRLFNSFFNTWLHLWLRCSRMWQGRRHQN